MIRTSSLLFGLRLLALMRIAAGGLLYIVTRHLIPLVSNAASYSLFLSLLVMIACVVEEGSNTKIFLLIV